MSDQSSSARGSLPIVEPPDRDDDRPPCRVGGILLAAGTSSRFGDRNKLLATHDGTPLVRIAAETLLSAAVDPVIVVVGHEADRVREALGELPVETIHNLEYTSGQATSLRHGIEALRARGKFDAALVALGDMPFVTTETIDALVSAYARGAGNALAAGYDGDRGNPVLFDRQFFGALTDVTGDVGGREILLESDAAAIVNVGDPGVRRDVDKPDDL